MIPAFVGYNKKPTIKPGDLVRTPSGRTARCIRINDDDSRELEDVRTLERFDMRPELLYLVRASTPRPWGGKWWLAI